jgi:hypothetical protein
MIRRFSRLKPHRLPIELVPLPVGRINLHELLPPEVWERLRRQVFQKFGGRCSVCASAEPAEWNGEVWLFPSAKTRGRLREHTRSITLRMPRRYAKRVKGRVDDEEEWIEVPAGDLILECDEIWHYNDASHVARLDGLRTLCHRCHRVKHFGIYSLDYPAEAVAEERHPSGLMVRKTVRRVKERQRDIQHFLAVNGCDRRTFELHKERALAECRERDGHRWRIDWGEYANLRTRSGQELPRKSRAPER